MKNTFNFSKKWIEARPTPETGRSRYRDSQCRGLGLMIQPNGHRSFYWYRKVQAYPYWRTIGNFPEMTVEQARDRAGELNTNLSKWKGRDYEGANPFEHERGQLTFGRLVDLYVTKHVKQHATHPDKATTYVKWLMGKYLAPLRGRNLGGITGKNLRDLHIDITNEHGRVIADRCIQFVRRVYFWGIKRERVYTGTNPATEIVFNGYQKRERFLRSDELSRLFAALRQEQNRDLRDFVLLSLFCGTRKSDTFSMRWQDLSLDDNLWRVPLPKGGKPYLLPLVPEAIEILRERKAHANGSAYVFPSPVKRESHVTSVKLPWARLLKRAHITDFTIHDMRRTFGSYQAGLGTSLAIIGKSLGHSPGSSATAVYARLDLQPVRDSMMKATQLMLAAGGKSEAERG